MTTAHHYKTLLTPRIDPRTRASIVYVTTGILLAELAVSQGLTSYSHIILDEVHERDTHVDLSMMVLKEVLNDICTVILYNVLLGSPFGKQ